MQKKLIVSMSPHIHTPRTVAGTMWNVVVALLPALAVALWTFGLPALTVTAVSIATCLLTEWAIDRFLFRRACTLSDLSLIHI